jgi:DNA-binding IclR family transcriptional regulator
LFVPEGAHRVCVAELQSAQPLSFRRGVGHHDRIVLGASGRAILAHTEGALARLKEYAAGLKLDLSNYPKELEQIRKRGYAVSKDELIQGAVAVAAPYFDGSGRVAGSIGVFGPGARLQSAQIHAAGALLLEEAAALSRALGLRAPPA